VIFFIGAVLTFGGLIAAITAIARTVRTDQARNEKLGEIWRASQIAGDYLDSEAASDNGDAPPPAVPRDTKPAAKPVQPRRAVADSAPAIAPVAGDSVDLGPLGSGQVLSTEVLSAGSITRVHLRTQSGQVGFVDLGPDATPVASPAASAPTQDPVLPSPGIRAPAASAVPAQPIAAASASTEASLSIGGFSMPIGKPL
jgi:hypothetical protein